MTPKTRKSRTSFAFVSLLSLFGAFALAACGGSDTGPGDSATVPGSPTGNPSATLSPAELAKSQDGSVLTGSLPLLNGEEQSLEKFEGDVVLVVNTASECGFSGQFGTLEDLYRERKSKGFVVLGFPADDVANQEPRDNQQISKFCKANFGVTFPMFAKSNVLGESANPLFAKLNEIAGEPGWNFNKYLIDRQGKVVEHFDVAVDPTDPELRGAIDKLL